MSGHTPKARLRVISAVIVVAGLAMTIFLWSFSRWVLHPWKASNQPSVLVILVENLGFGAFSCGETEGAQAGSGFQTFCDESVRFTHAYTPSLMSQATLGSILTAKYPYEHGLRHNGAQALSAKEETVAESALEYGYHTSFFSGGPPIWRRSGLNQGFETFDDSVGIGLKRIYRQAPELARLFFSWLDSDSQARERFLSFLFFPDLQFVDAPTTNALGEERESSFHSQIEAVDDALSYLVKEMKRRKIWDSTDVFLIGLQADAPEGRFDEIPSMNLYSESTRATLMIKPARTMRGGSNVFNWKVDANVSLADVGATLFDLTGKGFRPAPSAAALYSLRSTLLGPQPDWPQAERLVISESAWALWRGIGSIRAAVRKGPYLFLFDDPPRLLNTFTDNLEFTPLPRGDSNASQLRSQFAGFLSQLGFTAWHAPDAMISEKAKIAEVLWRERSPNIEILERLRTLSMTYPQDVQMRGWRATLAMHEGDWTELKAAALILPLQPLWSFVAEKNLGEKAVVPDDPCLGFMKSPLPLLNPVLAKNCRVDGMADLLAWANETNSETNRMRAMESFIRYMVARGIASKVADLNEVVGRRWDAIAKPDAPDLIDLVLALPEMKKYRLAVRARMMIERR